MSVLLYNERDGFKSFNMLSYCLVHKSRTFVYGIAK